MRPNGWLGGLASCTASARTLEGGFQTLNATVLEEMRQWLITSMMQSLAALGLRVETLPVQ